MNSHQNGAGVFCIQEDLCSSEVYTISVEGIHTSISAITGYDSYTPNVEVFDLTVSEASVNSEYQRE